MSRYFDASEFERKYRFGEDPWNVESLELAGYYETLLGLLEEHHPAAVSVLDLGCGEGSLTKRLLDRYPSVVGVDVSETAVTRAELNAPSARFVTADARALDNLGWDDRSIDLIVASQLWMYFSWAECNEILQGLARLLKPDGIVCIGCNCSGDAFFLPEEFRGLFAAHFEVVDDRPVDHHVLLVGRHRTREVVVSVDYEVREPPLDTPLKLDPHIWTAQAIEPSDKIMRVAESVGAKVSIFIEICQYWFLEQHFSDVAARVRDQLVDAVRRGHDVQVHMHTRWLPELGAAPDRGRGIIRLNEDGGRLQDLPVELVENLLRRAKSFLDGLLKPIDSDYEAIVFRAGKYQIQPHDDIFAALSRTGYKADSSVWHGGFLSIYDRAPGYDFRSLHHPSQPYWPSVENICQPTAPNPTGEGILELPILAQHGSKWTFDDDSTAESLSLFEALALGGGPRIMIGHTKQLSARTLASLEQVLRTLRADPLVSFVTLQDTCEKWWQLSQEHNYVSAQESFARRSYDSPEGLWQRLTPYHRRKVELLKAHVEGLARATQKLSVLDVGCGTGELITFPLASQLSQLPGVSIRAIDSDPASIARAKEIARVHEVPNVEFESETPTDASHLFDCIICTEVIEHQADPVQFASALRTRLTAGGVLLLTTPNGYGYAELERRILYRLFELALRLPLRLRVVLREVYRRLRRRRRVRQSSQPPIFGSLNFREDAHQQFFTHRSLRKTLAAAGFEAGQTVSVQALGGVIGGALERKLRLDKLVGRWPTSLASDWLVICRAKTSGAAET